MALLNQLGVLTLSLKPPVIFHFFSALHFFGSEKHHRIRRVLQAAPAATAGGFDEALAEPGCRRRGSGDVEALGMKP